MFTLGDAGKSTVIHTETQKSLQKSDLWICVLFLRIRIRRFFSKQIRIQLLKKLFDFFKTLLKITGSLQEFTLLTPISTEIITKLLKCKVNPWSWSKFSSKEMDYHCIEKPYILFLVQY